MSKAFTSEDATTAEAAPAMPSGRRPVTLQGMRRQRTQLQALTQQHAALLAVAAEGDADAYRRQRQQLEAKIAQAAGRIALSDVMTAGGTEVAAFGHRVQVRTPQGKVQDYWIVGPDEADAAAGRISHLSPLGQALIGARRQDEVVVHRPKGDLVLEVLAIALPSPEA